MAEETKQGESKSWFSKVKDWAKTNKKKATGIVTGVSTGVCAVIYWLAGDTSFLELLKQIAGLFGISL